MFIKENWFLLDSGKNIISYNMKTDEIYRVNNKNILKSLYTTQYDSQYKDYPFLSKNPIEDKKFIKTIKKIEKNIIFPLNKIGYTSDLIYKALSIKKFFSLKYDQMPLFPCILNNFDKMFDYDNIESAVCLGDDDLFCLHLAEKGIKVTVYDIDPVLLNFYNYIKSKYDLDIETKQQDIFKPFKTKQHDLCYINPTPNEKSSKRFFFLWQKKCQIK